VEFEERSAINILGQLIRIRTPQPYGDEKDAVLYLCDLFSTYPVECIVLEHGNNRASLIVTLPGKNRSHSIAIVGHLDTVGVDVGHQWQYGPFSAFHDGDRVYGRGAADMKGGVTSILLAALNLLEDNFRPVLDIQLCFTADEENGGIGAKSLCDGGYLDKATEIVVVKPTNEKIGLAEKGTLWLSVETRGCGAHAAMPDKGVNAIEQTALFAQNIAKWLHKKGKYPLLGHSTCTITSLHGGNYSNVVPEYTKASFDIRTSPCIDHTSILEKINTIAQDQMRENDLLKISYDVTQNRPALGMDENAPLICTFAEIYKKLKMSWKTTGIRYFTDASIFVPRLGVPYIIIGPGEEMFFHQPDEYVSIESILRIAKVLKEYLLKSTLQKS
jgi:succinyl-diaminopimelate desuccinylase